MFWVASSVRGLNLRLSLRPVPGFGKPGSTGDGEILIGVWIGSGGTFAVIQFSNLDNLSSRVILDFSASISAALLGNQECIKCYYNSFAGLLCVGFENEECKRWVFSASTRRE